MPRRALIRFRAGYAVAAAVLLAVETAIALLMHDALVRPLVGDALVVALVYCVVRAVTPLGAVAAAAAAFGIACAVEIGQALDLVDRLGLGGSRIARVVLGTSYDTKDFLAYALGAVTTLSVERWLGRDIARRQQLSSSSRPRAR